MPQTDWLWTTSQRRALILFLAFALVAIVLQTYSRPISITSLSTASTQPASEALSDRIDPNTAVEAEISTIPQIGPSRAKSIVAYREAFVAGHPGELAFRTAEDLTHIKGIGNATMEKMRPYLRFEEPAKYSQPASGN